jgi:hypothetical protein
MRALANLCNSVSAGSERFYAREVIAGGADEILSFSWAWQLYVQNDVDRRACTPVIQKAAEEALLEAAPSILRNGCARAFHTEARRVLSDRSISNVLGSLR